MNQEEMAEMMEKQRRYMLLQRIAQGIREYLNLRPTPFARLMVTTSHSAIAVVTQRSEENDEVRTADAHTF